MEKKSSVETELEKRVRHYKSLTSKALKKAKICVARDSFFYEMALDFKEMASSYYKDALYFEKQGNIVLSLASLSYSHAWLDSGARIGLFETKGDNKLFTLFK